VSTAGIHADERPRHPDHDQLASVVRDWFHLPFEGMGYRAERRRWGTYWNHGKVYTPGFPPAQMGAFLADVRRHYGPRVVRIVIDDPSVEAELGPLLCEAGCSQGKADLFLAHVGSVPRVRPVPGLHIEPVDESNLLEFAEVRLRGFADSEGSPDGDVLRAEADRRRAELAGTGRGTLARLHGEPAGALWRYDEPDDVWILLLATRLPFRRRGIGRTLLCQSVTGGYARGCRSVMLNVQTDNAKGIRLYQQLGFQDPIIWRRRYLLRT
jgi:ribosomal protein S18 acetylase RimI-like enzyme